MARKRTRQLGGSGGGTGRRAARLDVAQIQQEEATKARRAGYLPFEGSPLLRGLLRRSVADLAAREWAAVTGGAGVVLVDGKPQPVTVRVGASDGSFTEVSGDIAEGDTVVTGSGRSAK